MKGQYFSFDAIVASVIFVLALVALLSYWHSVKSYLDYQNDDLSREIVRVSNLLFTPPTPVTDCDSMNRFGMSLEWDDRRIDSRILDCAIGKNSSWLSERLDTPYTASISITPLVDEKANSPTYLIGDEVGSLDDHTQIMKITRLATILDYNTSETNLAVVELSMYK